MLKTLFMIGFRGVLSVCYLPFRLLKPQNKIVYLSRQQDKPGMDFTMLQQAVQTADPSVKQVMLCKTIGKSLSSKIRYGFHLFPQLYHLATAKAAVLDGYCISACLLKHHKQLKIYQLWHALGLLKNFGYAAIGNREGSSARTANIMRMHRGYHKILCSSPHVIEGLSRCYDAPPQQFLPIGMPRIDFLTDQDLQVTTKQSILQTFSQLQQDKPILLYAPTFRKGKTLDVSGLVQAVDLQRYHLVIKLHNGNEQIVTQDGVAAYHSHYSGLEWLAAADVVITDYSAIVFEAMTAQKPVILYCFDKDEYGVDRGFATDYDSIPAPQCMTPQAVMQAVEQVPYKPDNVQTFLQHHVTATQGTCTKDLCNIILQELKK